MNVTLDHIDQLTDYIRTFWFRPDRKPNYTAGQFIEINITHDNPDDRGIRRWFTLSSSPTDELISITTKLAIGQRSTFKQTLFALEPGAKLIMSDPMGDFVLPMDKTIPLLFVAGGLGITPIHSIVKWLVDTGEKRQVKLIYAAENPDDFLFDDLWKAYDLQVQHVVSHDTPEWQGEVGHITADMVLEAAGSDPRTLLFISGPEPMTEALVKDLSAKGISEKRMVTDYFPGYLPV